ncbi:hypothetical protein TgHK011_002382 [Trichoderma gracile]|nr:hypothetical protein TgHK011_002382 [Trichoderma gracile]
MASKIEFINVSHPSQISSSRLQRRAYSHAARVNHARVKLARKDVSQIDQVAPVTLRLQKDEVSEPTDARNWCLADAVAGTYRTGVPDPVQCITSSRRDPFGSFARPLSPLEQYLFDHYITIVTTQHGSKCVMLRDASFHHHQLRMAWIQLAMSDAGLLCSTFLSTCRHLYHIYRREEYVALATQYRILCIRAIRGAMNGGDCSARDSVIATIISLALDEVQAGNVAASKQHVRGLAEIVYRSGGPETLGMNGLLKHLFEKLAFDMKLLSGEDTNSLGLVTFVAQGGMNMPSTCTSNIAAAATR